MMLNISCAGYLGLSPAVLAHFIFKMCVAPWNCEKFTKTPYSEGSWSFKVVDDDTL